MPLLQSEVFLVILRVVVQLLQKLQQLHVHSRKVLIQQKLIMMIVKMVDI